MKNTFFLSPFSRYALLFFAFFSLSFVGTPFPLAILFSALYVHIPAIPVCLLYITVPLFHSFTLLPIFLGQALILLIGFFLRARYRQTHLVVPFFALAFALALFTVFAPAPSFSYPTALQFLSNPYVFKTLLSCFVFLFSATTSVALNALTKKLLQCRMKGEEVIFIALFFVLCGIGVCRSMSVTVYTGIAFFLLLSFSALTKDASALIASFVLAVPPLLCANQPLGVFFLYGTVIVLFTPYGRFLTVLAHLCTFFLFAYVNGVFASSHLAFYILSALVPDLLFLLLPCRLLSYLESKLVFYKEKHLPKVAINRNRTAIGEKLFEISGVFREISATFSSLGGNEAEESAMEFILSHVQANVCKKCPSDRSCAKKGREEDLRQLVKIGVAKGRASLIDVPQDLSERCLDQSGVLYALNGQLAEYHKYMLEAENAREGRALLSSQALGVSEVLKNLAMEQSAPIPFQSKKEKQLDLLLLRAGIVCSEILLIGEESPCLTLLSVGEIKIPKLLSVVSSALNVPMTLSEKLTIGSDRYCYILRKKPRYDAIFGVATRTKDGETSSGDTHSVIRIDEGRFMLALSDGMGSGEYAQKISESTISLLESFYRAKMSSPLVLSTINKLLTLGKEESFACVDIAVVDLDSGRADVVKIGSPMGFILSGNTLKLLHSSSLPLGILDAVHPDTASYLLQENDVLVFLSDGITGAFPSTAELFEYMKTVSISNPQKLADSIMEQALKGYGNVAKDDMTVLTVRIYTA